MPTRREQLSDKPALPRRVLMIGAAGGVGRATLALLEGHPLGRSLLPPDAELLLLDREVVRDEVRAPTCARWLPPTHIGDRGDLLRVLAEQRPHAVIGLAELGTWDCVTACAEHGASFSSTCFDAWPHELEQDAELARCMLRARSLFDPPEVEGGVHLLCMGMNPGLVNALLGRGLRELATRSRRAPSLAALELAAVLFTEIDHTSTVDASEAINSTFRSTWSPSGCLEEMLEPHAMLTLAGEPAQLDHPPHRALYEARCGDELIHGHIVPHEELVTLAAMYPDIDLAYVYRMAPAAEAALAAYPERRASEWPTERLYPPEHLDDLRGHTRIGALFCSRTLGELWIGWQTTIEQARPYSTNPTLLQVAAGVLAGWSCLGRTEPGVYLPEDLDGERLLAFAEQILGPLQMVWEPGAALRRIDARRII